MEDEDRIWVRRFKEGDIDGFNELVNKYKKRVYYIAYRMCHIHEVADDLSQEAFIKVYKSINSFSEDYKFYPWLYRIITNLCINYLKRDSRFRSLHNELSRRVPSQSENPAKLAETKELNTKIEEAVSTLSPKNKAVFVLRVYEGLSYKEISKTLGCSLGTVMSRLNRARTNLKELLEEYITAEMIE